MEKTVIIALDMKGKEETFLFLDRFREEKPYVKIGMQLFYSEGPDIVREIKKRGHRVFLDLKLHDIPNTVKKAAEALAKLDIDMCSIHAAGGREMMGSAMRGFSSGPFGMPKVIAVTQLTSIGRRMLKEDLLINASMEDTVIHYAIAAKNAGLSGVVCSVWEAERIHRECGTDFLTVSPGIRFCDTETDDQKRVSSPIDGGKAGTDHIVVGRAVTKAEDPVKEYKRCIEEFEKGQRMKIRKGDE